MCDKKVFKKKDGKWEKVSGPDGYIEKIENLDTHEYLEIDDRGGHQHYIDSGGSTKLVASTNEEGEKEYKSEKHLEKD